MNNRARKAIVAALLCSGCYYVLFGPGISQATAASQVSTQNLEKKVPDLDQPTWDTPRPVQATAYTQTASVELWTDPATGCKYVSAGGRSPYTVRVKANGLPLCE